MPGAMRQHTSSPGALRLSQQFPGTPAQRTRACIFEWTVAHINSPASAVTSCRAGLAASTPTPGRMAPDASFTTPAIVACASAPYFLTVLLVAFLDDQWPSWGAAIACMAIGGLPYVIRVPVYADILRGMGEGSPLVAHAMPWPAMAFSLALAAALFFAALKIVQRQEY